MEHHWESKAFSCSVCNVAEKYSVGIVSWMTTNSRGFEINSMGWRTLSQGNYLLIDLATARPARKTKSGVLESSRQP